jgi:hypothetical protein
MTKPSHKDRSPFGKFDTEDEALAEARKLPYSTKLIKHERPKKKNRAAKVYFQLLRISK